MNDIHSNISNDSNERKKPVMTEWKKQYDKKTSNDRMKKTVWQKPVMDLSCCRNGEN